MDLESFREAPVGPGTGERSLHPRNGSILVHRVKSFCCDGRV